MTPAPTPAFIDFEASSLDLVASYPIEVGICLPCGETRSWLIEPHGLWQEWSDSAQKIHGIPRQTLFEEGLSVQRVVRELNQQLTETVYCDAWAFDRFWLHRLYRAADATPGFQLESVSLLLSEAEVERWALLRATVIAELGLTTHRAANDALILHETWKRVLAERTGETIS